MYSFEGTDTSSQKSEIKFLASGAINPVLTYSIVILLNLKRRNLIPIERRWEQRLCFRIAIANWLGKRALESIPKDTLVNGFLRSSEQAVVKVICRRLSYLHDCDAASILSMTGLMING